jgi:hypothetical protein
MGNGYSRIRALLASNTKCIVALWTTTTINTFYQSCTGDPLGFAIKEKIKHNSTNNNIETPQSEWDTEDWWNRTHLTFHGDPTIRLYQAKPPADLTMSDANGNATLSWTASADTNILGYNVYKSNAEFGIYSKINSSILPALQYIDANYQTNDWYMVRAIKKMDSGCGQFLQPSIGVFTQGELITSSNHFSLGENIKIFPIPASSSVNIETDYEMNSLELFSVDGKRVLKQTDLNLKSVDIDVSNINPGMYLLSLKMKERIAKRKLIISR